MFLHHSMTDSEVLRVVGNSEHPITRALVTRLQLAVDRLEEINKLTRTIHNGTDHAILLQAIASLSKPQ